MCVKTRAAARCPPVQEGVVIAPIALQCSRMESSTDVLFVVVVFFKFIYNNCTARNIHQKETFNDLYHRCVSKNVQKTPNR